MADERRARFQILLAALLFSTGGAAIKLVSLSPWEVAGYRSGVAALTLLLLVPSARRRPDWRSVLVGVAYAATMLCFVLANRMTTAASTVFIQSSAPLWVLLLGPLCLRERLVARDLVYLALIALGLTAFFVAPGEAQATAPEPLAGNLLAAVSGLTWALTVMGLRWLGRSGRSPYPAVVWGNVLAFLVALPFLLPLSTPAAGDVALILWLGVFQIALAYVFVGAGLRHVPALEGTLLLLAEPVLSPIWTWLVHGERVSTWALAGGALVIATTVARAARASRDS